MKSSMRSIIVALLLGALAASCFADYSDDESSTASGEDLEGFNTEDEDNNQESDSKEDDLEDPVQSAEKDLAEAEHLKTVEEKMENEANTIQSTSEEEDAADSSEKEEDPVAEAQADLAEAEELKKEESHLEQEASNVKDKDGDLKVEDEDDDSDTDDEVTEAMLEGNGDYDVDHNLPYKEAEDIRDEFLKEQGGDYMLTDADRDSEKICGIGCWIAKAKSFAKKLADLGTKLKAKTTGLLKKAANLLKLKTWMSTIAKFGRMLWSGLKTVFAKMKKFGQAALKMAKTIAGFIKKGMSGLLNKVFAGPLKRLRGSAAYKKFKCVGKSITDNQLVFSFGTGIPPEAAVTLTFKSLGPLMCLLEAITHMGDLLDIIFPIGTSKLVISDAEVAQADSEKLGVSHTHGFEPLTDFADMSEDEEIGDSDQDVDKDTTPMHVASAIGKSLHAIQGDLEHYDTYLQQMESEPGFKQMETKFKKTGKVSKKWATKLVHKYGHVLDTLEDVDSDEDSWFWNKKKTVKATPKPTPSGYRKTSYYQSFKKQGGSSLPRSGSGRKLGCGNTVNIRTKYARVIRKGMKSKTPLGWTNLASLLRAVTGGKIRTLSYFKRIIYYKRYKKRYWIYNIGGSRQLGRDLITYFNVARCEINGPTTVNVAAYKGYKDVKVDERPVNPPSGLLSKLKWLGQKIYPFVKIWLRFQPALMFMQIFSIAGKIVRTALRKVTSNLCAFMAKHVTKADENTPFKCFIWKLAFEKQPEIQLAFGVSFELNLIPASFAFEVATETWSAMKCIAISNPLVALVRGAIGWAKKKRGLKDGETDPEDDGLSNAALIFKHSRETERQLDELNEMMDDDIERSGEKIVRKTHVHVNINLPPDKHIIKVVRPKYIIKRPPAIIKKITRVSGPGKTRVVYKTKTVKEKPSKIELVKWCSRNKDAVCKPCAKGAKRCPAPRVKYVYKTKIKYKTQYKVKTQYKYKTKYRKAPTSKKVWKSETYGKTCKCPQAYKLSTSQCTENQI